MFMVALNSGVHCKAPYFGNEQLVLVLLLRQKNLIMACQLCIGGDAESCLVFMGVLLHNTILDSTLTMVLPILFNRH